MGGSPRQESVSLAGLRVILSPSQWMECTGPPGQLGLFATRGQHQPRKDRVWAASATSQLPVKRNASSLVGIILFSLPLAFRALS